MIDFMDLIHVGKYYSPTKGGMETALEQIAKASAALGHRAICHVASFSVRRIFGREIENRDGVWVNRWGTWGTLWSAPLCLSLLFAHRWGRTRNQRILHLHLPNPLAELGFLWGCKDPWFAYLHAIPLRQGRFGRLWFRWITLRLLQRANRILVSSTGMMQIVPALEQFKDKIRVLPFAQESISVERWNAIQGDREGHQQVVAIGRLVPYKGYSDLIEAWSRARAQSERFKKFKLRILGGGPEFEALQSQIVRLGMGDCIFLEGEVSDRRKHQVFTESVALVAPSKDASETFGISVLEAFGYGLAVICSNIPGGMAVLARQGACGGTIQPGNIESIQQALLGLLDEPGRWKKVGLENLKFCSENYSTEYQRQVIQRLAQEVHSSEKKQSVVHFLGSEEPSDQKSGAKIRDAMALRAIASRYSVKTWWRSEFQEKRTLLDRGCSWFRSYAQGALSAQLIEQMRQQYAPGAVLWVSQLNCAKYINVAKKIGYSVIFDAHNIESDFLFSISHRLRDVLQAKNTRRFERKILKLADAVSVVSAQDQMRAMDLQRGCYPEVIHNAIDLAMAGMQSKSLSERYRGLKFLFVGTLDYYPNAQGLDWFCEQVLPLVRKQRQKADPVFQVCGTRPKPELLEKLKRAGVEYLGSPADLTSIWNQTYASFVPLLSGGGSRLKIPEAMAWKCPVVATHQAAEGLHRLDDSGIYQAGNAESFAQAILALCNEPDQAAKRVEQGLQWVSKFHSWQSQESAVIRVIEVMR